MRRECVHLMGGNMYKTSHENRVKVIIGWVCALILIGCTENETTAQGSSPTERAPAVVVQQSIPPELSEGETKFNSFCQPCHGPQGQGTNQGPPLVHKIYEPSHHADMAFQRAAAHGVRAHHWKFGNMPKIEGATPEDVTKIIGYIRWLQRQAGIF